MLKITQIPFLESLVPIGLVVGEKNIDGHNASPGAVIKTIEELISLIPIWNTTVKPDKRLQR